MTQIDLNLLTALDALLSEQSVTRAARKLGVGQPAASHALSRLRELFDDPLLVRAGRRMVPTPRAESLKDPVARWLRGASRLLRDDGGFDPATSDRRFTLLCPDLIAPILPGIVARLARCAPRVRFEVRARGAHLVDTLRDGGGDVALTPIPSDGSGLVTRRLGAVRFAVLARKGHPALTKSGRLSPSAWARHPHVLVHTGHDGESIVGSVLAAHGFERRIGLVVPSFLSAMVAVGDTDLFFTVPRQLAAGLAQRLGLVFLSPPIAIPEAPIAALWHERYQADAGHRFFRALVVEHVAEALRKRTRSHSA